MKNRDNEEMTCQDCVHWKNLPLPHNGPTGRDPNNGTCALGYSSGEVMGQTRKTFGCINAKEHFSGGL